LAIMQSWIPAPLTYISVYSGLPLVFQQNQVANRVLTEKAASQNESISI
jgi:hypothetical protein